MSTNKSKTASSNNSDGFSDVERAAMKARAKELKAEARTNKNREAGEKDLLEKIAEMPEPDRSMAARLHEIISEVTPDLMPKTWYGMPAYTRDGKVLFFFKSAGKYEGRYSTFGFNDDANLDDGAMWATSFALTELNPDIKAEIIRLVKKAVS